MVRSRRYSRRRRDPNCDAAKDRGKVNRVKTMPAVDSSVPARLVSVMREGDKRWPDFFRQGAYIGREKRYEPKRHHWPVVGRQTPITEEVSSCLHSHYARPKMVPQWLSMTPMGRLAELEDLQGAVLYLASELSDYMTGQDLIIDGGYALW